MYGTRWEIIPESWKFDLSESNDPFVKDPKTGWVNVDSWTFEQYEVGDYYPAESEQ